MNRIAQTLEPYALSSQRKWRSRNSIARSAMDTTVTASMIARPIVTFDRSVLRAARSVQYMTMQLAARMTMLSVAASRFGEGSSRGGPWSTRGGGPSQKFRQIGRATWRDGG